MDLAPAAASTAIAPPAPRRGRREKPWPHAKQKKLLRLYVCTQSERLPLVRILEILKDGSFDPRQRNSHKHLKNFLPDRRIDDWRPRDIGTMHARLRWLRSVRAERRIRNRKVRRRIPSDASLEDQHPVSPLQDHPPSFSPMDLMDPPLNPRMSLDLIPLDTLPPPPPPPPLPPPPPPPPQELHHYPAFSARSPSTGSPSTVKPESPGSTPQAVLSAASDTYHQDQSPSCASSIKSSSKSSSKSAKRRSWASVLSSISSGISSLARSSSSASSKGVNVNPSGANTALSRMTREEFVAMLQERPRKPGKGPAGAGPIGGLFKSKYSSAKPSTEDLNGALVRMCCANYIGRGGCVHERLSRAIDAQHDEGHDFTHFRVTDEEANMADKYGNALLHVAARWGARVSLLLYILKRTDDVQLVNHRGETFLHVFDPPRVPRMRPVSFLNLIRTLRARGFDFCHRDVDKQTFLHNLVARKEFPIETLYYVFREVGHGAARFLVANRSANGERLWHSVRRNLELTQPKLHRIFGDEVEFIRRYLPEFGEGKAPSTADTSTIGSDSLMSIHPAEAAPALYVPLDPNESNAQKVRRTPLMKLFRRSAAGRGPMSDAELTAKMQDIFDAAFKAPEFDIKNYLSKCDTEGNTALHYAAEFGLVPAVQMLCTKGASVNVFNNCGNTPLQLVKFAIQRTDVRSDIHMEARYLRCAVLLLEQGAIDQSKLFTERSVIFPHTVFDGSERSISNLMRQGVATQCRGLHLLTSSARHHPPPFPDMAEHHHEHGHGIHGGPFGDYHHRYHDHGPPPTHAHSHHYPPMFPGRGGDGGPGPSSSAMAESLTFQTSALAQQIVT
ncbi:hypothetical protein VTJ83DRAFT_1403 [Remersonia thermophila]|uniref:Ankyrin n=1 Tax=Remersonia thermophila TaxID=72144 RepID=A0ABR4DNY4_9PEZI